MNKLTTDTFFNGKIRVIQSRSGYRFSIDAVLLANSALPREDGRVLDLGTGCGIIPLILAHRHPGIRIFGTEIQKGLADIAILNVEANHMAGRITIFQEDMKNLRPSMTGGAADMVISNPPYRKPGSGRVNPDQERAIARHEIRATLSDLVQTARRMLRISGHFVTIYPADRMTDLLTQMRNADIEPKSFRTVHSGKHTEAKLILAEGIRGARPGGIKIAPPLIIYDENGNYTDEVSEMFGKKE
ncbi:MAG: hypothetical protein B6245_18415 [Desulfobacteraceae bacterium 4572_88]|nr:MAG: hypothetical protein B6245_18415 [Desulfobacteraceae bacterium 4572_88]